MLITNTLSSPIVQFDENLAADKKKINKILKVLMKREFPRSELISLKEESFNPVDHSKND